MIYCEQCGSPNGEERQYCGNCNSPLNRGGKNGARIRSRYSTAADIETENIRRGKAMPENDFWEEAPGDDYIPGGAGGSYGPGGYPPGGYGPGAYPPGEAGGGSAGGGKPPRKKLGVIIASVVCALAVIGTGITVGALYFTAQDEQEAAEESSEEAAEVAEADPAEEVAAEGSEEVEEIEAAEEDLVEEVAAEGETAEEEAPEAETTSEAKDAEAAEAAEEESEAESSEKAASEAESSEASTEAEVSENAVEMIQPTPTEAPTAVRLLSANQVPNLSSYSLVGIAGASATSTISQAKNPNDPILAFDNIETTSWQEGVSGYGIGETLRASFDKDYKVRYIAFRLGNWKNDYYFWGNARPKTLTIKIGDFVGDVTFNDGFSMAYLEFNKDLPANAIEIVIKDIYTTSVRWQDTVISDILIYGLVEGDSEGGQMGQSGDIAW